MIGRVQVLLLAACCGGCLYGSAPGPLPERVLDPPRDEMRREVDKRTGDVLEQRPVRIYPDGGVERHGMQTRYYAGGGLESERSFAAGEPVGRWRSWYPDGQLRSDFTITDEPSPMVFYHPNGQISATGMAVRGVRDGLWTFWHENGVKAKEGRFVGGGREGLWTFWYANGGLEARGLYHSDERAGEWELWRAEPPTFEVEVEVELEPEPR